MHHDVQLLPSAPVLCGHTCSHNSNVDCQPAGLRQTHWAKLMATDLLTILPCVLPDFRTVVM